jgi:hypothetical protein
MKFEWNQTASPLDGELLYRQAEYSIDFKVASNELLAERVGGAGNTSLAFTTLQIEVGIERRELLYPWGLFPNTRWQIGHLSLPVFQNGRVRVISEGIELQSGVSISIPNCVAWPIVWDRVSGWICFGLALSSNSVAIEYAKGAAVVIAGDQIVALWLRPKFVEGVRQ